MILRIEQKEIPVYQNEIGYYAIYASEQQMPSNVSVEILMDREMNKAVSVKPLRQRIHLVKEGAQIRFEAPVPSKLSVEFEDSELCPLFLFLYTAEKTECEGDKVRRFAAGVHELERLELHSGETLYLEEGAVLRASLFAFDGEDIMVCGRGIIDASCLATSYRRMVDFRRLKNVTVRDVTLTGSFSWCLVLTACENVTVDGVNIMTWRCTGDGIDLVGSNNVLVQNCFIRSNDDCVAIKAVDYFDPCGMQNVHDVTVRSCVMWNAHFGNGIEIGFETRCDEIYNVVFEDLDIIHCEHEGWQSGGTLTIHNGDRAWIHDVIYRDIEEQMKRVLGTKVSIRRKNKNAGKIEIDYYRESDGRTGRMSLCFALENGKWYLDSPAF